MNKEQLLAAAEVMRRAAEGEPVQVYMHMQSCWRDVAEPCWSWERSAYRIKPREPREVFIGEKQFMGAGERCGPGCTVYQAHSKDPAGDLIKFREVVE